MKSATISKIPNSDQIGAGEIAPWIYEASNPYVDWLYGDSRRAYSYILDSLNRTSSELFLSNINALFIDNRVAGGFIAFSGKELQKKRKSDAMFLLMKTHVENRKVIRSKLISAEGLFNEISGNVYYLSRIGLLPEFRGMGFGRLLIERYLAYGEAQGFTRFALDVSACNITAIKFYEKYGFQIINQTKTKDGLISYVSMSCKNN